MTAGRQAPPRRGGQDRRRRSSRARRGSGRPARGGSRGSRPARRARCRAPRARREALVEVRAGRLRQRVVGRVADQQVPEAEAVLAWELRLVRPDQLPCGRAPPGAASPGSRRVRAPGRRRGGRSRLRSRRARARPLGRLELVEARGEQRLQRRRDDHVALRLAAIASISSMKSGLPPAARAIFSRSSSASRSGMSSSTSRRQVARAEASPARRGGARQLRPRHAEQQDRRARGEERDVLDQVEERLLAPLDVVEDDDQRPLRRCVLERLAERPGDLLRGRRRLASRRATSGSPPRRPRPRQQRRAASAPRRPASR